MCRTIPVIAVFLTTLFGLLPSLTVAPERPLTDEMRGHFCLPLYVNFGLQPVFGVISRRCSPEEVKKKAAAELVGKDLSLVLDTLELPRADRRVSEIKGKIIPGERPLSDYRYHNEYVKYEKLEDKGLKYEQVAPAQPMAFGRPKPAPLFATAARQPGKTGSIEREEVSIQFLEEAGVDRRGAPISFGFPLPRGGLFDLKAIRLLSPGGEEVPAQFTATAFWPDDSLKWVLVDARLPLKAGESREVMVEFGKAVKRTAWRSPLQVTEDQGLLTVVTGPLKVEMDKQHFNLFRGVWRDANGDGQFTAGEQVAASGAEGLRLVDEGGNVFTSAAVPPESVKIEERGPQRVVVRVEGRYGAASGHTYMRYIARLTFRAGSSRVTVACTHIDDYLKTEFTDITSLSLPVLPTGKVRQTALYLATENGTLSAYEGEKLVLFQSDEKSCTLQVGEKKISSGRAPGLLRCETQRGTILAGIQDFWEHWPKGLSANRQGFSVELLPLQPSAEYGTDLPYYLMYPFVSGKYRFKWGMSFTERITFDFGGETSPEEMNAETRWPVIAVLPATWYARTKGLGRFPTPLNRQFALWDQQVAFTYTSVISTQAQRREYGYFNYGDQFGERVRNWFNNEYGLAHGWFMAFARTGNRDYFRMALASARHQADVDIVHAYPDPLYIGANQLHSVCHTGTWTEPEVLTYGTWTNPYGYFTTAANGHVWSSGMVDAWELAGETRVMEAAIGLGEHITWAMAPNFKVLGPLERTAGWSLQAIMSIYRATYDPLYLAAAKRIAEVAMREQKFDEGGVWPHTLPGPHAGKHPGAKGNMSFLIGILLGGLKAYHEESGDTRVAKSLKAASEWFLKSWDQKNWGWPGSADSAGQEVLPFYLHTHNSFIINALAYVALLTGDERLAQIAEKGLQPLGDKNLGATVMFNTYDTLALLQQWYAQHSPDNGKKVLSDTTLSAWFISSTEDAKEHAARRPNEKVFYVQERAAGCELVARRTPWGSMSKRAEFGAIKVFDSKGAVVRDGQFSTDGPYKFLCSLPGEAGAQFKILINDDQRGVWTLSGEKLRIVVETSPGYSIGGVGRKRYYFFVPAGTQEFRVKLAGLHTGVYGGVALTPTGEIAGVHRDLNPGQPLVLRAVKANLPPSAKHSEQGTLTIRPAVADTGKVWTLILWAAIDIGVELEGVPPYLALSRADWFEPRP